MNAPQAGFPLFLNRLIFTKSVVEAIPNHEPTPSRLASPPENSVHVEKVPDAERTYVVRARTVVNSGRSTADPYFIDMECMAVFVSDETLTDAEAARGAMITGHSVTIGAIREAVSWITGRHVYGPLLLGLSVLGRKPDDTSSEPPAAPAVTSP